MDLTPKQLQEKLEFLAQNPEILKEIPKSLIPTVNSFILLVGQSEDNAQELLDKAKFWINALKWMETTNLTKN